VVTTVDGFSGFSVDDVPKALAFYRDTLGLDARENDMNGIELHVGATSVFVYPKPNHVPATFTVLNLVVPDIDAAADELAAAGVELARYEGMPQDGRGIMRGTATGDGPDIAWFTDPAGNVFAIIGE
jgi:catechol 2,3-dioxygenase-like lactoylglutathione lyase family enzyme